MNRALSGIKAAARPNERGITLVETMVAAAVSLVLFGAVLASFIAQQRAFVAALYQMDSQGDENRVLAYISRDLRQASVVSITANGTNVALTLPVQAAPTLNINLGLPLLSLLGGSTTPPATTAIQYFYRRGIPSSAMSPEKTSDAQQLGDAISSIPDGQHGAGQRRI